MAQKLIFETGLDGSGFERGLARLGATGANSLKNFVAGAFGVYSIAQAISKTVESADELVTSSKRLDTSVEQLQILRQAAKESGVEFSNLEKAFEGFNVARDKALSGGKEGAKMMGNFGRLGVTEAMLRSQTVPTAFNMRSIPPKFSRRAVGAAGIWIWNFISYSAALFILSLGPKLGHYWHSDFSVFNDNRSKESPQSELQHSAKVASFFFARTERTCDFCSCPQ